MSKEPAPGEPDPTPRIVELARQIQQHVDGFVADDEADPDDLSAFLDELPRRERARLAREVFLGLSSERQWEVLATVFGDPEIREHLEGERERRMEWLRDDAEIDSAVLEARGTGVLDLRSLPTGCEVGLGLFRPDDVRDASERGATSDVCARRLMIRIVSTDGEARVIEDVFNPRGGLFVTSAYDVDVWESERWPGHTLVRVGSAGGSEGTSAVEPLLFPGARVDAEFDGKVHLGRLHLGYALIGGRDVFAR